MKTKEAKIRYKNKDLTYSYVEFTSLVEALDYIPEADLLRIYNFGAKTIAKLLAQGKDPFKPKQRIIRLKTANLSNEQLAALASVGLISEE